MPNYYILILKMATATSAETLDDFKDSKPLNDKTKDVYIGTTIIPYGRKSVDSD
jgi:hypothetical protein